MADGTGFALNIDTKFMQDLAKVEQKIQDIATASEKTRDIVIDSFTKMRTQGLDPFIQSAKTFQQEMRGMRVVNVGLGVITREAATAADKVNVLVDAMNKLLAANGKLSSSDSKDANVSKVNQLYKERLQIEERLHKMMLKGAKGGVVSEYESNNISRLAGRMQNIDREIESIKKSSQVSTQTILAIIRNEEEWTKATQRMIKERMDARNAEAEQQKKDAETERVRQAQLAKQRAEMYKKQNYAQNTTAQGALSFSQTAQTYNREKQAIEYLTIARNNLSKSDKDYARTLEELNKAIRKHEENLKNATKTQEELSAAQNKRNKAQSKGTTNQADKLYAQNIRDYNNAMKASEATVNQRTNKLAKLRQVESQLAQDQSKYATQLARVRSEIDRLTKANEAQAQSNQKIQNSQRNLMDTAGQLQRKLALLFSVSAIQGYVNKLVEVRGEFEMQQRSLQVLLQNKDEANELWDKTVALAVKSPFRIKDLVTYTKQLAAYRIESDKLFETNKMLADISAGLGVDMNRLILAFGQVKAANYLRGTELRQFSEAGVNMLGELAKYFTELEGRAVSVGDVFERVSKRMVTFQDVNEIFRRLTSEGGVFFKMQEKQSETLRGMIMNFRDSMDLMLNDIGKDQDSMLKNSIRLAKDFVDNWRQFEPLIKTIGVSFLVAFGVKTLMKIASGVKSIMAAFAAHPLIAVASVLGIVVTYLYQAAQAQSKLNAAMMEVENENLASLEESIGLYRQLTETINDTTKSYEERDKAMSQLKSKFNEILPDQYTELQYVEKLGDNYRDAEQAMLDYYNAKTIEQKKARVEQEFASELEGTDISELIDSYRDFIDGVNMIGIDESKAKLKIKSGIASVVNSVVEDVKSGAIPVEDIQSEISKRLEKFVGDDDIAKSLISRAERYADVKEDISDIIDTLERYSVAISNIEGLEYETYDQKEAAKIINKEKNNLTTAVTAFKKAASLYQKYVDAIPDATSSVEEKRKKIEADVQKILSDLPKEMTAYGEYLRAAFAEMKQNADAGAFDFASTLQTIESKLYGTRNESGVLDGLAGIAFNNIALNESANDAAKQMVENFKEGLEDQAATLAMNDFQKAAIQGAEIIAEKFKVSTNDFVKFVPKYGESLSDVRQRVKAEIENMTALLQAYNLSITTGASMLSENVLSMTKEQAQHMTNVLPALKEFLKFLGESEKGGSKRDKLMDERIKVIDDMNKKYKELNKTLSKTESLRGAFDAYKDAFASAYGRSDVKSMTAEEFASKVLNFPNENDIVKWLDNLAKTAKNTEDKIKVELAKGEYVYDMKVRAKVEDDKKLIDQIEDMFSGYEMSIELQKMNIPPDLAKQLFNLDSLTLPELRDKVLSMQSQFVGTDMEEDYRKYLKKIDEMEEKAQVERLKKYTKYLIKAQGERVKIKLEEMRAINDIESLGYTDAQKSLAKQAIQKETQQALDNLEWEEFKDSGMYVQLFEDLQYASTNALEMMRSKLLELKDQLKNLDADDLRNLYNQIEKLDNELAQRNPYKTFITGADEYINAIKESKRVEKELDKQYTVTQGMQKKEEDLSVQLAKEKSIYEQMSKSGKASSKDLDDQKLKINFLNIQLDILKSQLLAQGKLTKDLEQQLDGYKATRKTFEGSLADIGGDITEAANALPNIAGDLENVFGTMSAGTKDTIDSISTIAGGVGSAIQGFASGNYIQAIAGVAQAIGGIFAIGDKKKERQIQREIKFVEDLERAYEKLEKAIDNAYSINTLQASGQAAKRNLDAQIASYNKMIQAEEDKKKTDSDRIKEWQLAIEDLIEQKAELDKELVSVATAGIMDDVLSASQEFTDAWLSAFQETGDGLSGLEENFRETMLEMVKQQASMLISQSYIEKWKKQLEQYINPDDLELSTDEAKKWVDAVSNSLPQLNQALENYFNAMQQAGVDISGGSGELSGLAKGISGITESQADILAAYANSCRFFLSNIDMTLTNVANQILGGENVPNPMLSELRTQTELVRGISTLLNSVVRGSHSMGGQGIKVFIS